MTIRLRVQQWLRDNHALYADQDPETARLRAALLGQVMRLTPLMMAANVGCGLLVLWCFRAAFSHGMAIWFAALLATAVLGMLGWWRDRHHRREAASGRAMRRSTAHAAVLAGLWAVAPLVWFPAAEPGQQLLVATLVAGMLAAGAFVLSPLPRASLAWAVILTLASLGALRQTSDPTLVGVELLMGFMARCWPSARNRQDASMWRCCARRPRPSASGACWPSCSTTSSRVPTTPCGRPMPPAA